MKTSFIRFAVAAATIATLGVPAAFAQKNQSSNVHVNSTTTVVSSQNSFAGNLSVINQDGGKNSNQDAHSHTTAVSAIGSTINASSANIVVVSQ